MLTLWHVPEDGVVRNPYGQLLSRSLTAQGVRVVPVPHSHLFSLRALTARPDAIHFQFIDVFLLPAGPSPSWWRALLKGPLFLVQVLLLRLAGCRIVWTVHNLSTHERRLAGIERWFSRLFTRLAHEIVVHGERARTLVSRAYRVSPERITVLFHPNYDGAYPDALTRAEARHRLAIDPAALVVLSLGPIREYKGLPDAVRAFRALPSHEGIEYWIAGDARDARLAAELQGEAAATPHVHVRTGHVPPEDVEVLCKASDVIALPYRNILTSGAAILAMTFRRPCIAPRLGCIPEVLEDSSNFLYDPAAPDGFRDALARMVASAAALPGMGEANRARVANWTWDGAAQTLIGLYRGVAAPATTPAGAART